jgi:hypothetical protein
MGMSSNLRYLLPGNLISNYGFEQDTTGWADDINNSTISQSAEQVHSGAWALKVVTTAVDRGPRHAVTVLGGRSYTYRAYVYCATPQQFYLELTDNTDQGMASPPVAVPANTWTKLEYTDTTDAHTARTIRVSCQNGATTFYVDDVSLALNP